MTLAGKLQGRGMVAWLLVGLVVTALASPPVDLERIRSLIEAGRYDEAIAAYGKILEGEPQDVNALFQLGTLYRWKGDTPAALDAYSRALSIDPEHYDARVGRARVLMATGNLADAEVDLEAARRLSPQSNEVRELLAELRFRQRDFEKGEALLAETYQGAEYHRALGNAYRSVGERARAVGEYEAAFKLGLDDAQINSALGDLYLKADDLKRSMVHYSRLVVLAPDDVNAHFWLGTIHRRERRVREAEREFREALRLNPRHVDSRVGLGRVLNFYGQFAEAIELSRQVVAQSPKYGEARSVLGRALESQAAFDEAYREFAEALVLGPRDEEAWRGVWRTAPLARPGLGGTFRYYDSKALEGRGNPPPFPIRTRYSGYRFAEDGRYPVSPRLAAVASTEQFRDTLDQESAGFTIYDVTGYSFLAGGEYWLTPRWKLTAQGGQAWFESETDDPINREQVTLMHDEVSYRDPGRRLGVSMGYDRGSLLGRSLEGTFDFALFSEDRIHGRLEKSFGDHWDWSGGFSYFRYSDGTERVSGFSGLDFTTARQAANVYARFAPVQSRFLKTGDRLEFVDAASGGGRYSLWIVENVELAASYAYTDYSDSNAENFGQVSAAYRLPCFSPVSVGVADAVDDFRRVSPRYNSFDSTVVSPFLRVKGTVVPHFDYNFYYAHGFRDESFRAPYDADEVSWVLEYFWNVRFRLGTEGYFTYTALNERSRSYRLYVRILL